MKPCKKFEVWYIIFLFRKTILQFVSPLRAHQMSWTEFVYLFVYFWKVLESFGTFWKKAGEFELGIEIEFGLHLALFWQLYHFAFFSKFSPFELNITFLIQKVEPFEGIKIEIVWMNGNLVRFHKLLNQLLSENVSFLSHQKCKKLLNSLFYIFPSLYNIWIRIMQSIKTWYLTLMKSKTNLFNCADSNGHAHVAGNGDERDAQIVS